MERFARSRTVRCCMLVVAMMIMNPFMVASEGEIGKLTTPCGEIEVPVMTIPNVVCITYCGPDVGAVRCADANKDQEVVDPRFALVSGSDVQILIRGYVDVGSFSRVLSAITGWTVKNTLDESIRVQPVFWRGSWAEFSRGVRLETPFKGSPVKLTVDESTKTLILNWE